MGCNCRKSNVSANAKDFCSTLGMLTPSILVETAQGDLAVYVTMPDASRMELREAIAVWRCGLSTGTRLAELVLSAAQRVLRRDTLTSILGRPVALNLLRERLEAASR